MKTINKLMLVLSIFILTIGTAICQPSDDESTLPSASPLDQTPVDFSSIKLCSKITQPSGIPWGVCDDRTPSGVFEYYQDGAEHGDRLNFYAQATGLGVTGFYPEVTNLHVVGTTVSTITWGWHTPNKHYFTGNKVTVKKTSDKSIVYGPTDIPEPIDSDVFKMITGLEPGTSYTIIVQSNYITQNPTDRSYSLIYYKDIDTTHSLPTTKVVTVLDTQISVGGVVTFSGWSTINSQVPATDDANIVVGRGKIWIIPTNKIKPDFTVDWTGYSVGSAMPDYLYEEDKYVYNPQAYTCDGHQCIIPWTMGGITYNIT